MLDGKMRCNVLVIAGTYLDIYFLGSGGRTAIGNHRFTCRRHGYRVPVLVERRHSLRSGNSAYATRRWGSVEDHLDFNFRYLFDVYAIICEYIPPHPSFYELIGIDMLGKNNFECISPHIIHNT